MSNSVRTLGSGRSVDAVTRSGAGHQADPAAGDAEFSAVMNLAIGATEGAAVANGEGGGSDGGGVAGGAGHQHGQHLIAVGDNGNAPDAGGGTTAVTPPDDAAVPPVRPAPSATGNGVIALLASADGKSPSLPLPANVAGAPVVAAVAAPNLSEAPINGPHALRARRSSDPSAGLSRPSAPRADGTNEAADGAVAAIADPTPSVPLVLAGMNDATQTEATDPAAPTSGSSIAGVTPQTDTLSSPSPSPEATEPAVSSAPHRHGHGHARHAIATVSAPTSGSSIADVTPQTSTLSSPTSAALTTAGLPLIGVAVTPPIVASSTASSGQGPAAVRAPSQQGGFDRFGWRIRLSDTPPAARPIDETDPTSPPIVTPDAPTHDPKQGTAGPSGPSIAATRFSFQTGTDSQSADGTGTTIGADPPVSPAAPDQRNLAAVATTPVQSAVPPILVQSVTGPVEPNVTNGARLSGLPNVLAIDGVGGTPALNPPSAPTVTVATASGSSSTGTTASFGDAVANQVMSMISTAHQEATLQLQPPQLGDLTIRVAVQGREVSTWFGAAQPQVQLAVGQALDQLRADLAGAGLNLAGAWVGADASTMQQRNFDTAATPARRGGFAASPIDRPAGDTTDRAGRASGVSVYV